MACASVGIKVRSFRVTKVSALIALASASCHVLVGFFNWTISRLAPAFTSVGAEERLVIRTGFLEWNTLTAAGLLVEVR